MSSPIVSSVDDVGAGGGGATGELELRRRLLNADGPIEEDEAARQKMRNAKVGTMTISRVHGLSTRTYAGFNPRNVQATATRDEKTSLKISPMSYFARKGDLPMMRWLYVNGADTRDKGMDFWFPMYAASFGGKNNACMWLHKHGAAEDVERQTLLNGLSPLKVSFDMFRFRELSRWLILEGALSKADEPGILDIENMLNDINRWDCVLEREMLLQWAKEKLETRISFLQFLNGTFSPPEYSVSNLHRELAKRTRCESAADILLSSMPPEQKRLLWEKLFHEKGESPLKVFAGKNGILKSIGDFAVFMAKK